jgi:hypothetical protein
VYQSIKQVLETRIRNACPTPEENPVRDIPTVLALALALALALYLTVSDHVW